MPSRTASPVVPALVIILLGTVLLRSGTEIFAGTTPRELSISVTPPVAHKPLLPLDGVDVATIALAAIGLVIAAGGGIGGGGFLVPLYMLLLKFTPKHAIALSNVTIFGGSIANCLFNIRKTLPNGKPYIDWDIIVMMEPSTIAGAVIGSFLSKFLPNFVLTVALTLVLGLLSFWTLKKGITDFRKENERMLLEENAESEDEISLVGKAEESSDVSEEDHDAEICQRTPWSKVGGLVLCFVGCILLTILRGSGSGSIIGVVCGTPLYWLFSGLTIPWVVLFQAVFRSVILQGLDQTDVAKAVSGHEEFETIKWTPVNTITYPLVCTVSGLFAGLFGVGGGIVKGPLMLALGVNSLSASATAATMIFFTSSAACVSFYYFGLLVPDYSAAFFFLGFSCTAAGQAATNIWIRFSNRMSPPVLSIGTVMILSTMLVAWEVIIKSRDGSSWEQLVKPTPICSPVA